eukprot:Plantae.Rhodophyta-Hildenbrandia_rubra.ctg9455.p1 GENE.Plantae.Rhodophyta-Hildenbrandia_rubra.ctg9455~~Plantae.Rhodophyta-Hildenbrandia_rubra.ctg9455.p1  ORF type:complete len:671 (-),score=81.79 Plantae.Rhodophyta-Hildenbrandia_rubra.ctg9455:96-2033(-)
MKITADPNGQVGLFDELRKLATSREQRTASLAILTEMQLFKDVAPAYRIKMGVKDDSFVRISKPVMQTRSFEQAFLRAYQKFLASMKTLIRWRGGGGKRTAKYSKMENVRRTACIATCEAIKSLTHFNESEQLVAMVTQLCNDSDVDIRKEASAALQHILASAHRRSGHTLKACVLVVQSLAKLVLQKGACVAPEVIEPLLATKLSMFKTGVAVGGRNGTSKPASGKKALYAAKKAEKRRKVKRDKAAEEELLSKEVERDLKEAEAEATSSEVFKAKRDLLHWTCQAYFNLLKAASEIALRPSSELDKLDRTTERSEKRTRRPPRALGVVLDGLLFVAPLINPALVEALLAALTPLLEYSRLPLRVRFRCMSASYSILATHAVSYDATASTFTKDAHALDKSLYMSLGCLYGPQTPVSGGEDTTGDALTAVVAATHSRRLPMGRASALSRRLINRALFAPSHGCSIGLLTAALSIIPAELVSCVYPQADREQQDLLGCDGGLILQMDDDLEDPDITKAERSAAWDLSCLMGHWHPEVQRLARDCATGSNERSTGKASVESVKALTRFTDNKGGLNPPPFPIYRVKRTSKAMRTPNPERRAVSWPSTPQKLVERYWNSVWCLRKIDALREKFYCASARPMRNNYPG